MINLLTRSQVSPSQWNKWGFRRRIERRWWNEFCLQSPFHLTTTPASWTVLHHFSSWIRPTTQNITPTRVNYMRNDPCSTVCRKGLSFKYLTLSCRTTLRTLFLTKQRCSWKKLNGPRLDGFAKVIQSSISAQNKSKFFTNKSILTTKFYSQHSRGNVLLYMSGYILIWEFVRTFHKRT